MPAPIGPFRQMVPVAFTAAWLSIQRLHKEHQHGRAFSVRSASSPSCPRKSWKNRSRTLRSESLEPRTLLSGMVSRRTRWDSPRRVRRSGLPRRSTPRHRGASDLVNGNAAVSGKTASLSVLGADDGGESHLVYNWSVAAAPPAGVRPSVSTAPTAQVSVATFTKAGTYTLTAKIIDAGGLSVSTSKVVVVTPTLTSIRFSTAGGRSSIPARPGRVGRQPGLVVQESTSSATR